MNYLCFSSSPLPLLLFSLFIMLGIPVSLTHQFLYENFLHKVFECGNISAGYPFYGGEREDYCGRRGLKLYCDNQTNTTTTIEILGVEYQVLDIHHDRQILRIAREDLINNSSCSPQFQNQNPILDSQLFDPVPNYTDVTLFYDCQSSMSSSSLGLFSCNVDSTYKNVSVTIASIRPEGCLANVTVPILRTSLEELRNSSLPLQEALKTGFEVQWKEDTQACRKCNVSGGTCGFDMHNHTVCYCRFPIETLEEAKECHRLDPSPSPTSAGLGTNTQGVCHGSVIVPIYETTAQNLEVNQLTRNDALKGGFKLQWEVDNDQRRKCTDSDGVCGRNQTINSFICFCRDQPSETICSPTNGSKSKQNLIFIGLTVGVTISIVLVCTVCFIVLRFKGKSLSNHLSQRKMNDDNARIEAFITKFGSLAPRRYFYRDIKKMTDKFKDKLGQGGNGSVYKGKLTDGCLVAVKVLSESKGNGEDFMNEVASISRTSHVNIVSLLGFCFERSKRALVYEFMPRGSLDKFIYNHGSYHQRRHLEWKTLYDIALGIARGLEYLHQGCNTRILHFDIKPHNILLDENFCPKISDFGLSKLCERKESIISMTGARGTAGYIAPEVFCRNFGGVSHKSDVYSYGMMVLEMVGGRKNIDVGVSQTSEVYFPSWIYKHLDQSMNLNLNGIISEEEEKITRKLIVVSLWCIQSVPFDRPSMTKVVEMLQGSLQSLEIPPRPFVSSPIRSPKMIIN